MSEEISFERIGAWGVVTLTREKALNALTLGMVQQMRETLLDWADDASVKAVLMEGAGERAFCAGGDIRWLHDTAKTDPAAACAFFQEEYRNNAVIHHYPKPYVALIDGIVMGGGVGLSVHGDYRIAGDATLFAMPETGIGLFPDVGGGYFMPRLADGLGLYYALTGARAKAADCRAIGVATHYTPSEQQSALRTDLLADALEGDAHAGVQRILSAHNREPDAAPIESNRDAIAWLFQGRATLRSVFTALEEDDSDFSRETLETLARMSPTSIALTFEQMRRGAELSFNDAMKMEFRMVSRVMEGHDFFEGVRAQILDKDRNPQWSPARLEDVHQDDIETYFAPLGGGELTLP
ncbi:MAG: enoyl-CoA hydratase/isomerase family protein [Pseudomonadota bacterium]